MQKNLTKKTLSFILTFFRGHVLSYKRLCKFSVIDLFIANLKILYFILFSLDNM